MRIFLSFIILFFGFESLTQADDIRDFEIDGISIGDSLLNLTNKEYIISEINANSENYSSNFPKDKFGEVYLDSNKEKYSALSFFVKTNDPEYKIYMLRGIMRFNNDLEKCLKQKTDIVKDLKNIFVYAQSFDNKFASNLDSTGRSFYYNTSFILDDKSRVVVQCSDWEESLRKKNNWMSGLSVVLQNKEFIDWMTSN